MILNEVNGKIYIGQTYNKNGYRTRWNEHKSNLRNNNHGNKHLQCAWSTYGEESFEFILLHELVFDTYKDVRMYVGINKSSDNVSNSLNGNSGINTCMGYKWRYADRNGNIKYTQYDRKEYIKLGMFNKHTGELIKIFSTKKDACDYLNIKHSNRIYMCLTKKAKTAYGYIWREIKTDKFNHVLDIIY